MKKSTFYGVIKNGLLLIKEKDKVRAFCAMFDEDTAIKITIEKDYKDKSDKQLGYYFAVVVKAAVEESGYSREEIDGIFCKHCLTQNVGTSKEFVKSKTKCSTVELNELIDGSRDLLAKIWGIVVPDPDKNWKEK